MNLCTYYMCTHTHACAHAHACTHTHAHTPYTNVLLPIYTCIYAETFQVDSFK